MTLREECWKEIDTLLDLAMAEDIGPGDITTNTVVPESLTFSGAFVAREAGVAAGMEIVKHFFSRFDAKVSVTPKIQGGEHFEAGHTLGAIEGPARSILTGERIALNVLQRMCGIASLTQRYVKEIAGTSAKVYDTRKTLPGWRSLDKLAVFLGGGENHRHGLFDMVLIKDNHIQLAAQENSIASAAWAVRVARENTDVKVQIEVDTLEQMEEVLPEEPDMILLDNMPPAVLVDAVARTRKICAERNLRRPLLEASGGITLKTIRAVAETGVDRISVGAVTHSAVGLDIGLDAC